MRHSYSVFTIGLTLLALVAAVPAVHAASQLRGGLVINEILIDPNGVNNYDTDGNGTADTLDEFIELYNVSAGPIDLTDLQCWDDGTGNWYNIPGGSIAAGGRVVIVIGVQAGGALPSVPAGSLALDAGRTGGVINNGGDNAVVYDPNADEYIQILYNGDAADNPPVDYAGFSATATLAGPVEDFGSDSDGISLVRNPEGSDTVVLHNSVGVANASPGNPTTPPVPVEESSVSRIKDVYRD